MWQFHYNLFCLPIDSIQNSNLFFSYVINCKTISCEFPFIVKTANVSLRSYKNDALSNGTEQNRKK